MINKILILLAIIYVVISGIGWYNRVEESNKLTKEKTQLEIQKMKLQIKLLQLEFDLKEPLVDTIQIPDTMQRTFVVPKKISI